MVMNYIDELKKAIRNIHGVDSTHINSVPVKETFHGKTVWDGVVEVFQLHGHPTATKAYAWSHQTDDPKKPIRHVAVLHLDGVTSPLLAVRAAIVKGFRDLETPEEA
jgi:hypothetical protein